MAVNEGLGTYGESRGLTGRPKFGEVNSRRLQGLYSMETGRKVRRPMPACRQWIGQDDRLRDAETQQVAYSEAWLLIHYLMKTPTRLEQFRKYLIALGGRREAGGRIELWESHFGETSKLDRDLDGYCRKLGGR